MKKMVYEFENFLSSKKYNLVWNKIKRDNWSGIKKAFYIDFDTTHFPTLSEYRTYEGIQK